MRLAPALPVIAFDAVQGSDLGPGREVLMALPFAPARQLSFDHMAYGALQARRAAELVVAALGAGARDAAHSWPRSA